MVYQRVMSTTSSFCINAYEHPEKVVPIKRKEKKMSLYFFFFPVHLTEINTNDYRVVIDNKGLRLCHCVLN